MKTTQNEEENEIRSQIDKVWTSIQQRQKRGEQVIMNVDPEGLKWTALQSRLITLRSKN